MRTFLKLLAAMSRIERILLAFFSVVFAISLLMLLRLYYVENSELVPVTGGTYIEGSVGELLPLNPWFVTGNDVNRDIASLVFAGLMKHDPRTEEIVDGLAEVKISSDNRVYTATLKPGLLWHDSTEENPHPVTADDVLFTFETIQKPGFGNPILQQNFRGVEVEKIDERTVRFRLSKPYSFFTSNLTLGLVPKASFDTLPVEKLSLALDFGFHPVGAGPYAFQSLLQTDLSTEVTLKRFPQPGLPETKIDRIVFRIFPDYNALLTDILNLNAVRQAARNTEGKPILPRKFTPVPYTLPQYVGVFFNLDHEPVSDRNLRLGMQLATNKQEIVDAIHETNVVDTPLLEIDLGDWKYKFDVGAAQGSLFDSSWNVPEKVRLQRLLEQRETNMLGPLSSAPRIALLSTGATLTFTGSTEGLAFPISVNGIRVMTGETLRNGTVRALSGAWMISLPAGNGMSGSLKTGMNVLRLTDANDDLIDSSYLERLTDAKKFAKAGTEQRLVEEFVAGKQLPEGNPKKLAVQDLYLEDGFLRKKRDGDAPHTRINDRGEPLKITLLTSPKPETYPTIARILQREWEAIGASVTLDIPETQKEFENKLTKREYDAVLFGQSLFDNLDSYPYWHSSQIQDLKDPEKLRIDAFNLSQYTSFEADALLTKIRETASGTSREKALSELNALWKTDIPGIILYSPLTIFAHDDAVQGIGIDKPSLHADRFAHIEEWYASTKRRFVDGKGWLGFLPWLLRLSGR